MFWLSKYLSSVFRKFIIPIFIIFFFVIILYLFINYIHNSSKIDDPYSKIESILNIAQSFVTIIAILFGGIWTYYKFFKGRTMVRRLELELSPNEINLKGKSILSIECNIKNIGNIAVTLFEAYITIAIADPDNPQGITITDYEFENRVDILTYHGLTDARYVLEPNEFMHRAVPQNVLIYKQHLARIDLVVKSKNRCWSTTTLFHIKNG